MRASNTQPVLVARCEASTPEGLAEITEILRQGLGAQPAVGPFKWDY